MSPTQSERVAVLARYLAAWRRSEQAGRAYTACEIELFGLDAVRALEAREAMVGAGIVTREETAGWHLPVDLDRPPTAEQLEAARRLASEATRAEQAAEDALLAVSVTLARDGHTFDDATTFDDLLRWAGVDMDGLERGRSRPHVSDGGPRRRLRRFPP